MSALAETTVIAILAISFLIGLFFIIWSKFKNIIYSRSLMLLGMGFSLLLLYVFWYLDGFPDNSAVTYILTVSASLLTLFPPLSSIRYEDDYFETRTIFLTKEKYFYKDATGYEIKKYKYRGGYSFDEIVIYFGQKKTSFATGPNTEKLMERINSEYRKRHGGAALPKKTNKKHKNRTNRH